jgi:urease accessory protein
MTKIQTRPLTALAIAAATVAPTAALAHPGHGPRITQGLTEGLLHPWTGMDHFAALLLTGAWATVLGGRALRQLPAAMLLAMVAGFVAAPLAGSQIAEALAAFATLSLVAVAALRYRAPLPLAVSACALFGFGHGLAHGLESAGSPAAFTTGMVASSAMLMGLGVAGAEWVLRSLGLARVALPTKG